HPIAGDTMERIFYAILNEPLNIDFMRQSGAPEALCRLALACAEKLPSRRPQGFGHVSAELEQIMASPQPTEASPAFDSNAAPMILPKRRAQDPPITPLQVPTEQTSPLQAQAAAVPVKKKKRLRNPYIWVAFGLLSALLFSFRSYWDG